MDYHHLPHQMAANAATDPWHRLSMQRSVRRPQTISRPSRSTSLRSNLRGIPSWVQLPWNFLNLPKLDTFEYHLYKKNCHKFRSLAVDHHRIGYHKASACRWGKNPAHNGLRKLRLWRGAESMLEHHGCHAGWARCRTWFVNPNFLPLQDFKLPPQSSRELSQVRPRVWWFGQKELWDHYKWHL